MKPKAFGEHSPAEVLKYAEDIDAANDVVKLLNELRKDAVNQGDMKTAGIVLENTKDFKDLVESARHDIVDAEYTRKREALERQRLEAEDEFTREWTQRKMALQETIEHMKSENKAKADKEMADLHAKLKQAIESYKPSMQIRNLERRAQGHVWVKEYTESEALQQEAAQLEESEVRTWEDKKRREYTPRFDKLKVALQAAEQRVVEKVTRLQRDLERAEAKEKKEFAATWERHAALLKDHRQQRLHALRTVPKRLRAAPSPSPKKSARDLLQRPAWNASAGERGGQGAMASKKNYSPSSLKQSPARSTHTASVTSQESRLIASRNAKGPIGTDAEIVSSQHPATRPKETPDRNKFKASSSSPAQRPKSAVVTSASNGTRGNRQDHIRTPNSSKKSEPRITARDDKSAASRNNVRNSTPGKRAIAIPRPKSASAAGGMHVDVKTPKKTASGKARSSPGAEQTEITSPRRIIGRPERTALTYDNVRVQSPEQYRDVYKSHKNSNHHGLPPRPSDIPVRSPRYDLSPRRDARLQAVAVERKHHEMSPRLKGKSVADIMSPRQRRRDGPDGFEFGLSDKEMERIVNKQLEFIGSCIEIGTTVAQRAAPEVQHNEEWPDSMGRV